MNACTQLAAAAVIVVCVTAVASFGQSFSPSERTLFVNDQQAFNPGYAIGNVAIADPKVADFKVMPGRRELLLLGKGIGATRLTVWDQKNVKRDEMVIHVTSRQTAALERDLQELLRDFPSVKVQTVAGALAITGAVSSKDDLTAIERIASATKVQSLVRYVAPVSPAVTQERNPMPQPTPSALRPPTGTPIAPGATGASSAAAPSSTPSSALAPSEVEYEIELLEASVRFRSGSYATGVEPSGRSLFKGVVKAPLGAEREIFIGGAATDPKKKEPQQGTPRNQAQAKPPEQGEPSGIRLKLRPGTLNSAGRFQTFLLIETNLPIGADTYDPSIWRRARWEFNTGSGEPFGITGGDLLATPDMMAGSGGGSSAISTATRATSTASRIPGVSGVPGVEYVPVFGSLFGSRSYKQKTTQLLVIMRPRVVPSSSF